MPAEENEEQLIERARAGDELALERLLIAHSQMLALHIAARLPASLQSVISVEDVTQEAMTHAFLKIDRLRETSPRVFVAWLRAVGETTLMGMIKAQRRRKRGGELHRVPNESPNTTGSLVDLLGRLPGDGATASRQVARREAVVALQVAISRLPEDTRRAIQLHLLQSKSLDETAKELGRTPAAVRSLIHRGKQALSEAMVRASMWLSRM